jgi:hypothetical protein
VKIEVSNGELVDKATILAIKLEKIKDREKLQYIRRESDLVHGAMQTLGIGEETPDYQDLKKINLALWEIEDKIRIKESRKEFDGDFIALARKVYRLNDERARVKRRVNLATDSALVEVKEYVDYK